MARFLERVLPLLDRIYRFDTARTTVSDLELNTPIQLVHDVSRQAELGTGFGTLGGFWYTFFYSLGDSPDGYADYNPFAGVYSSVFGNQREDADDYWVWLMSLVPFIKKNENSKITSLSYAIQIEPDTSAPYNIATYNHYRPVFYTDGSEFMLCEALTGGDEHDVLFDTRSNQVPTFPHLVPFGGQLKCRWVVTADLGAPFIQAQCLWWAGKKGVLPPGMR